MMISVITPTYNKAVNLNKVYHSLSNQTNHSIEWIIIDDGSTDNTQSVVVEFLKDETFPIRYLYKENGGRHTAINLGISEARGDYCIIVDPEDKLTSDAIDTIIKDGERYLGESKICGMSYTRRYLNSNVSAKSMEEISVVSNNIIFCYNQGHLFGRVEVMKTSLLNKYLLPEIEGERYIDNAYVLNTMAQVYDTVYFNKDIYVTEIFEKEQKKKEIAMKVNNPKGCILNYEIMMMPPFNFFQRFKYSVMYNAFCFISKIGIKERIKSENKPLIIVSIPTGFLVYLNLKKYKKNNNEIIIDKA